MLHSTCVSSSINNDECWELTSGNMDVNARCVQVSCHREPGARGRKHHLCVWQRLPVGGGTQQLPAK